MKSILMKLLVLAVCAAMLLSLFACDGGNKETEAPTDEKTEAPTDEKTEAPTQKETEAPTQKETEAPTQKETESDDAQPSETEPTTPSESESTQAPVESDTTGAPAESDTTGAPAESDTTGAPAESDTTGAPAESDTTGAPAESETTGGTPTESETVDGATEEKPTEPEEKPTEPEEKPTEPEEKPTEPEEKPTEPEKPTETEPEGPKCDGNHPIKAKGDQGHYEDKCDICGTDRGTIEDHTYETVEGKPTCSVCGWVASCEGVHAWQSDENGHWTEKCTACDAPATESAAHEMAHNDAGEYRCTVCEYLVTCDKNHALTDKGEEGHEVAACIICNTTATVVPHAYEDKDGSRFCACGNEAACKGQHNWAYDADGHWADACDVCGAAAVEKTAHAEYSEFVTAEAYNYGCATCGYAVYTKAITAGVKGFMAPGYIATGANIYYNLPGDGHYSVYEDGMAFSRFNGNDAVAQIIWQRAHEDMVWNQFASDGQQGKVDIGNAKYLVMKIRTNATAEVVNLNFSTTGANSTIEVATEQKVAKKDGKDTVIAEIGEEYRTNNGYSGIILPLSLSTSGEWTTYVIDLEKAFPTQMVKDAETGTYVVDTFYFHINEIAAATNLDIAYAAYVDGDWSAVDAFVDEETAVKVVGSNKGSVVYTEDGKCVGEHAYEVVVVDGYYEVACACGASKASYGVKADAPNKFFGAETISGKGGFNGKMDLTLTYEENVPFVRINNCVPNADNWFGFTPVTWENGNFGRYMVMKFRIGENGINQSFLQIYTHSVASKDAGINWPAGNLKFKVTEDNQWHYIVIDMEACVPADAWQADANGNYAPNYFQFRPFASNQPAVEADDYMDISYIAFFDSMDDIKNIVDTDTYEWSVDSSTNTERYTYDNSCVSHAFSEKTAGEVHTVSCDICGEVLNTFNVPADINWYSPLGNMDKYNGTLNKFQFDRANGVLYNSFVATASTHWNITGGGGAGAYTGSKYSTGEYVVIKYRAGSDVDSSMTLYLGTGDVNVSNVQASKIGTLNAKANDGWRVAVVKITDEIGYAKVKEGDDYVDKAIGYTVNSEQTLYFMAMPGGGRAMDIAFIAVVDSIDEMKLLLGEGETYLDFGTSLSNPGVEYDQAGAKVPCRPDAHVASAPVTNEGVCTVSCAKCDQVLKQYSADIAIITPAMMNAPAETIANTNEDLIPNTRFQMTAITEVTTGTYPYFGFKGTAADNKTAQFIWNRSEEDVASASAHERHTFNVGAAKYFVIKIRMNVANAGAAEIHFSTPGVAKSYVKVPYEVMGNEWVTYVIDLETVLADNWKANEDGDYIVDTFYFNLYNFLADDAIDIEYMAFVPGDWTTIDGLVDEGLVRNITDKNGNYTTVYTADGVVYGTKAEDPINVTFDADMSATVKVPANTTFYYAAPYGLSEGMILTANGEALEFVAGNRWMGTPSTFSITNDTDAAVEYTLVASYPVGSQMNPEVIDVGEYNFFSGDVSLAEGNDQGYYYTFTATEKGKLTFYLSDVAEGITVDIVVTNLNTYAQKSLLAEGVDNYGLELYIEVEAGDVLQVQVVAIPDANWNIPAAEGSLNVQFSYPAGTEGNPIAPEWTMNETWSEGDATVTVPAGATVYFAGNTGMLHTVNGEAVELNETGAFSITNNGEADAEYTLHCEYPVGALENPAELVLGENTATLEAETWGYYFTWTATADGTLTLTFATEGAGWSYAVNNMTSYVYGDTQWSDSDPVVNPAVIEVKAGDVLQIQVNTYDPADQWNAPAGTVTVAAAFAEPAVVVEDLSEINDMADGTKVQISGTVTEIDAGWNETTGYMSVYVTDAFGESILCYRLATKVLKGDIITVTGEVGSYKEVKQIAAGATAVVTDHDTSYDVVIPEVTIAEALELADGTDVIVTGTVISAGSWSTQYGNMNVTIKDEAGNELYIYRLGTKVEFGDIIKVTGVMATYNGRQIGEGATAEIVGTHECTEFTDATCTAAPECVFCGTVNGEALGHNYVDGSCTVCGSEQPAAGQVTASKNIADLITSEGWTNTTTKQSFNLDDNVTVKVDGGNNSGKAYNGDHIRIYATDSPAGSLTISVAAGYELVSVTISTKTGTYAYITVDGATDISNTETAVSGSSVVLTSVKNGSDGKQVQVTAIEVVYAPIA